MSDDEGEQQIIGTYEGERNDKKQRHGKGKATFPDESSYEGDYVEGKKQGYGVYTYKDGSKYEGGWQNNLKHGEGTITYSDGSVFKGTFVNGKRAGVGEYAYNNGDRYLGNWRHGLRSGEGLYKVAGSHEIKGYWSGGGVKSVQWDVNGGFSYNGVMKNNAPADAGLWKFATVDTERVGTYKEGVLEWEASTLLPTPGARYLVPALDPDHSQEKPSTVSSRRPIHHGDPLNAWARVAEFVEPIASSATSTSQKLTATMENSQDAVAKTHKAALRDIFHARGGLSVQDVPREKYIRLSRLDAKMRRIEQKAVAQSASTTRDRLRELKKEVTKLDASLDFVDKIEEGCAEAMRLARVDAREAETEPDIAASVEAKLAEIQDQVNAARDEAAGQISGYNRAEDPFFQLRIAHTRARGAFTYSERETNTRKGLYEPRPKTPEPEKGEDEESAGSGSDDEGDDDAADDAASKSGGEKEKGDGEGAEGAEGEGEGAAEGETNKAGDIIVAPLGVNPYDLTTEIAGQLEEKETAMKTAAAERQNYKNMKNEVSATEGRVETFEAYSSRPDLDAWFLETNQRSVALKGEHGVLLDRDKRRKEAELKVEHWEGALDFINQVTGRGKDRDPGPQQAVAAPTPVVEEKKKKSKSQKTAKKEPKQAAPATIDVVAKWRELKQVVGQAEIDMASHMWAKVERAKCKRLAARTKGALAALELFEDPANLSRDAINTIVREAASELQAATRLLSSLKTAKRDYRDAYTKHWVLKGSVSLCGYLEYTVKKQTEEDAQEADQHLEMLAPKREKVREAVEAKRVAEGKALFARNAAEVWRWAETAAPKHLSMQRTREAVHHFFRSVLLRSPCEAAADGQSASASAATGSAAEGKEAEGPSSCSGPAAGNPGNPLLAAMQAKNPQQAKAPSKTPFPKSIVSLKTTLTKALEQAEDGLARTEECVQVYRQKREQWLEARGMLAVCSMIMGSPNLEDFRVAKLTQKRRLYNASTRLAVSSALREDIVRARFAQAEIEGGKEFLEAVEAKPDTETAEGLHDELRISRQEADAHDRAGLDDTARERELVRRNYLRALGAHGIFDGNLDEDIANAEPHMTQQLENARDAYEEAFGVGTTVNATVYEGENIPQPPPTLSLAPSEENPRWKFHRMTGKQHVGDQLTNLNPTRAPKFSQEMLNDVKLRLLMKSVLHEHLLKTYDELEERIVTLDDDLQTALGAVVFLSSKVEGKRQFEDALSEAEALLVHTMKRSALDLVATMARKQEIADRKRAIAWNMGVADAASAIKNLINEAKSGKLGTNSLSAEAALKQLLEEGRKSVLAAQTDMLAFKDMGLDEELRTAKRNVWSAEGMLSFASELSTEDAEEAPDVSVFDGTVENAKRAEAELLHHKEGRHSRKEKLLRTAGFASLVDAVLRLVKVIPPPPPVKEEVEDPETAA
eukprot:Rmarinus@m.475